MSDLCNIFILHSYLQNTFGDHLPYEIIYHIILSVRSDVCFYKLHYINILSLNLFSKNAFE